MAEPEVEIDPEVAKGIARQAAEEQEVMEWAAEAGKYLKFWKVLREGGMGKQLAGVMVLREQANYHDETIVEDDDG